jgi:hypothetical protein
MSIIELPSPALWFDMTTGHWKVLSKPDRPTYEPYYTIEQMWEFATLIRAAALEEAAGVCDRAGERGIAAYQCYATAIRQLKETK